MSTGNMPNVEHRNVSMEHLRRHPRFSALPLEPPEGARENPDLWGQVRQDTQLWADLHDGMITSSTAAAVLGLLEDRSAKMLNIPARGHDRAVEAWRSLCGFDSKESKGQKKIGGVPSGGKDTGDSSRQSSGDGEVDRMADGELSSPGAKKIYYKYNAPLPERTVRGRSVDDARLAWGNAQEATAILVAMDVLPANAEVREVGLLPDADRLLGASPDAMVLWRIDGVTVVEPLEVKTHSPFGKHRGKHRMQVFAAHPRDTVAPLHFLQAQLEMVVSKSQSCLLVYLSAAMGARVFRVFRDDGLLKEVRKFVDRFRREFVEPKKQPRQNFFTEDASYTAFVLNLRAGAVNPKWVKQILYVDDERVQRGPKEPFFFDANGGHRSKRPRTASTTNPDEPLWVPADRPAGDLIPPPPVPEAGSESARPFVSVTFEE